MTAEEAYVKAKKAQKRLPELEPIIIQEAEWAYWYVKDIVKERCPEAETVIIQDLYWSFRYAREVIKGRWHEAEPIIMQDVSDAYTYARDVIKGRWPEAEPIIMQDAVWACIYALNIIHGRWLEAEPIIAKLDYKSEYIERFFDEPVITKDKVDIIQWERKKQVGYFAPASMFETKVSLLDMVME